MAILRPTWQDIITEHSVETWQDWPWDTWLGPYAVISPRRYRVRVRVYRAGEWVDITSRVASGVIRESNDQPVATLELRLLNGPEYPSLAPRRKDSPLNRVQGQYVPLLWIGRLIAVEAAFSEDGSEPDEWWPVFLGELEDEIDTESGPDGTYVRVFCRDMATRLQRAYIAGPWTFENMYASQMIQAILDDAYSEGLIQEPVTVRLIGPDDFWVERYDIEYTDLWSALQRFCQQRGTDLRYRLNEQTGQIELTYWLPDRAMVPGWVIDASQVRREELRISGTDIINRVTVRYRDAATGQRAEVTVQDADSIAMYGLRHGLIEEPDTDLIPDAATAQKLAQTVIDDLKDVPALTRITCPFDPRVQLFDKLRVANPNVRDESEDYAIEGRELSFSATDWSMVLVGGGRVVVKRQAWLERMATEGVKRPFTPRDTTTSVIPPAPTIVEAKSVPGGVQLTLDPPLGLYWNGFIIHASTTPNFTPSGATEVAWGSETRFSILGLQPGTTYYFKAQAMDFARNRSAASNEVSATAGALTPDGFTAVVGNALVTTDGGGAERVVVGDLSGRIWRGQPLPPGTYGQLLNNGYLRITTPDGHVIIIDPEGIEMTPAGFSHPGMILTGYALQFWDKDKNPSIGIGDVRDMAAQLGSDMEYGLLMNQGEIRASQAVLEASLTDFGVTRDKLGPGSVDRDKLSPESVGERQIQQHGIGITRLGEQIQVPLLMKDSMNVMRMEDTSTVSRSSGTAETWYDIGSALTFPKTDRSRGLLAEALRVVLNVRTYASAAGRAIRLRVNNQTVAEWPFGSFENDSEYKIVAYVDARSLPADGQVTVQWQWRSSSGQGWSPSTRMESNLRQVFQNDQLPLRWGAPQYTLEEGTPSGCFGGCQVSCQESCQATCEFGCEISCQNTCESACQTNCQQSCQSTCETTSQGGGGCIREGTPITIWDPDIQAYREVPVEQLQPGMILPGYNPETDTLEHGELIRLEDAKFSNRFLRIHTDNGPSVDVTYTQPFDVLANMGDGWRWYRLHAKFLKPGMKLVRPFEEGERRFSTITQVEHAREHMVHFWNPKVSNDRYLAAGYADWVTK